MFKRIRNIFFFLIIAGCVEPYDFRIVDSEATLVVEATVSDKSFNETVAYPSNGRYFSVKLSRTSDVTNVRPEMVSGASVRLITDGGEAWEYTTSASPGIYVLGDNDFKALPGIKYKLAITLSSDEAYESDWAQLPAAAPVMNDVSFHETAIQQKSLTGVVSIKGVTPVVTLPAHESGQSIYYRWKFEPTWIFVAPLAANVAGPNARTCWATNSFYIRNYVVQEDREGGYEKDLLFIDVEQNERVLEEFSMLVVQHTLSEDNYYFWKEMQSLNQDGGVFDTPPFNLKSNLHSLTDDKQVSGYFSVAGEQAKRWYFNLNDLSYNVPNWLVPECNNPCGPGCPPPACVSCMRYEGGTPTNIRPEWWGR